MSIPFTKGGKDTSDTPTTFSAVTSTISGNTSLDAFLGKGTKIVGNLTFTGPVEIDGHIEGEVNSQDKLTVGEAATVNAKINGAEILVKGTVNGDITASKKLTLKKPAKVRGNIITSNLSIEEGVIFEGKCTMGSTGAATSATSSDKKRSDYTSGAQTSAGAAA